MNLIDAITLLVTAGGFLTVFGLAAWLEELITERIKHWKTEK